MSLENSHICCVTIPNASVSNSDSSSEETPLIQKTRNVCSKIFCNEYFLVPGIFSSAFFTISWVVDHNIVTSLEVGAAGIAAGFTAILIGKTILSIRKIILSSDVGKQGNAHIPQIN